MRPITELQHGFRLERPSRQVIAAQQRLEEPLLVQPAEAKTRRKQGEANLP